MNTVFRAGRPGQLKTKEEPGDSAFQLAASRLSLVINLSIANQGPNLKTYSLAFIKPEIIPRKSPPLVLSI